MKLSDKLPSHKEQWDRAGGRERAGPGWEEGRLLSTSIINMRCKLRFIAQLETTKLKSKCLENEAATETKNIGNNHKAGRGEEGRVWRGECKNYAGNTCLACKRTKQQQEAREGWQHSGTSPWHKPRGGGEVVRREGAAAVVRDRSCT